MTCPHCHQTLVEVDNPIRREVRHRRGTECVPPTDNAGPADGINPTTQEQP